MDENKATTVVTEEKECKKCKKSKKKGRKLRQVFIGLVAVIVVFAAFSAISNLVVHKAELEKANSFAKVEYDSQLQPKMDEKGYWSFTTDENFKVLQLTDIHIGGGFMSSKKDGMAMNSVAAMVTAEKPDLVIITGDISYPVPFQAGTFNNLYSAKVFAELMESLGVYWTLGYGNHDTEAYSYYSREDLCALYGSDDYKYCLFQAGPDDVDGYGNQVINIKNSDGIITQSLFVFDSHSYVDGDVLGIMWKYDNIHENQVQWYKDTLDELNAMNNKILINKGEEASAIKSSAFFHIPLTEQRDAWYEYVENGFEDTEDVKFVFGKAGEKSKIVYSGIYDDNLFEAMLEKGSTQAVFCGHDHYNNFSIEYKGIRLTYGMSVDYLAYPGIYKLGTQRGCTIITFAPDGSFDCTSKNYYEENYDSLYEKETVELQEITQQDFVER